MDGYEPVDAEATPNEFFEVPMQRVYRLGPDATSVQALAPKTWTTKSPPAVRAANLSSHPAHERDGGHHAGPRDVDRPDSPGHHCLDGRPVIPGSAAARETVANVPVGAGETLIYVGWSGVSVDPGTHTTFTVLTGPLTSSTSLSTLR